MMRSKPGSSMQKTYDECYLTCSTAVYFEGQSNEAEALRSWRSALDQIYYHNAYKLPTNYVPKSETEKALHDSLKQLERQCKERVDLLEALKRSRKETAKAEMEAAKEARKLEKGKEPMLDNPVSPRWIGEGTVPPVQHSDLSRPPTLPPRPSFSTRMSTESMTQPSKSLPQSNSSSLPPSMSLPVPSTHMSRTPSPDHKHKKTMLTTLRTGDRKSSRPRTTRTGSQRPAPLRAAGMAWDTTSRASSAQMAQNLPRQGSHDPTIQSRLEATATRKSLDQLGMPLSEDELKKRNAVPLTDPGDHIPNSNWRDMQQVSSPPGQDQVENLGVDLGINTRGDNHGQDVASSSPTHDLSTKPPELRPSPRIPPKLTQPPEISYRKEFPPSTLKSAPHSTASANANPKSPEKSKAPPPPPMSRKPLANSSSAGTGRSRSAREQAETSSGSGEDSARHDHSVSANTKSRRPRVAKRRGSPNHSSTPPSSSETTTEDQEPGREEESPETTIFSRRKAALLANLPRNVDLATANQILNEIIIQGDEVHWSDVAGLDAAKKALKEAVVYPFLRPDLFMGLREPARGMLLFGPPGTGKTMLARAVATESKSTFFAISASSLTSKWHGESEKLVRALFSIAKRMAPSIIFVDEIDSLLGSRGGSGGTEHEASRRSKTEFLIQWSDLQKAAAGSNQRDHSGKGGDGVVGQTQGDPTRVLVLAATNMPWDIDEAARRRFVRRQYIPLPEAETRQVQIRTLLGHQKHEMSDEDIEVLVQVTEGFSGSDITALAKDAAMGPLRNLGEALLYTPMDEIRPITFRDFEASLDNIRPSVSKAGLKEYEDWAKEFGERGG